MSDPYNPYAKEHENPSGPGDSRPTALQIVKDEGVVNKLSDKVVLITGATSGVGIEIARALHETEPRYSLLSEVWRGPRPSIELLQMELDSMDSVRNAAEEFKKRNDKLNIIVTNAGIIGPETRTLTKDGFELAFATNHLGNFLLFQLLKPLLLASASPEFCSRVVIVSSLRHRMQDVNFDDLDSKTYERMTAYGQSKLASIWMANHITRLYGSQNLFATSVHPGLIFTPAAEALPSFYWDMLRNDPKQAGIIKSAEQGAATTVWAAIGKQWEGRGAKYLEDVSVRDVAPNVPDVNIPGPSKEAYNPVGEERLWKVSNELLGIKE
ncbi:hypothetical protein HYE68_002944 [Fusarium pseudograminearum]|nr:hypothetical protein HYE68_002944 [Fusarium pseudograminearum]